MTFLETVDRGDADWKGNVGVITTLIPKVDVDPARTRRGAVRPADHVQVRHRGAGRAGRAAATTSTCRWSGA